MLALTRSLQSNPQLLFHPTNNRCYYYQAAIQNVMKRETKKRNGTCSLWPCGKYTTWVPAAGKFTNGPAHACHSSVFIVFFSPPPPAINRHPPIRPTYLIFLLKKKNFFLVREEKSNKVFSF